MLNAGDFIPGRAVVFGDLGFNDDLRIELIGDDEIRCLVKPFDALGPLGLAIADAVPVQRFFNGVLKNIANQLAY